MRKKKYIEYNYEELFDQDVPDWDEYFLSYLLDTGRIKKTYAVKETMADQQLYIEIYPEYTRKEAEELPDKARKKNPEAQKNLNDRNSRKRFTRLAEHNFHQGDYWLTLTYSKEPENFQEALKNIQRFFKNVNGKRRRRGLPNAKYLYITELVTEDGEPVRAHHHVLIDGMMDIREVEATWRYGRRNEIRPLEKDADGITGANTYMTKIRTDKGGRKYQRKWSGSQNLAKPPEKKHHQIRPKAIRKMVKNQNYIKDYMESQKRYQGYITATSEVRYNQINGQYYINARMRRITKEAKEP